MILISKLIFLCAVIKISYGELVEFGVTASEQKSIVNIHNEYRQMVANGSLSGQPVGTNILRMYYDDYLAQEAQKIANTTVYAHSSVSDDRFQVGQNLYLYSSTGASTARNWARAIESWFNEYKNYNYSACCSGGAGHYTQVIWAKTYYVGCGYAYYTNMSETYAYRKFYVCNYGPTGNIVGLYPYETGESQGCEALCESSETATTVASAVVAAASSSEKLMNTKIVLTQLLLSFTLFYLVKYI
ncbi:hypothetical protein GWI33_015880 [Rhynchophorus ferrugineus]|uniref:SCP domain-containing protein n=1 Tax=Rhynchophorus ferrugineus TaxID=354439 RepID=A0A834I1Z1_RHYFE|nr:hypothetical protein GWI33_015880 [Rhynchophorus ferrugineus]